MITDNSASYIIGYISAWFLLIISGLIVTWAFSRWKTEKRARIISGNILALLLGIGIFVMIMEGYYGFFYDQPDSYGLLLTSERWFKRHYKYNKVGFRDNKDYHLKKGPKKRIVFIGDSFTIGHGIRDVNDRFPNRIEAYLEKKFPGSYEVYTIARNGWDTTDEIDILSKLAADGFEADMVVLCFTTNDISFASLENYLNYQAGKDAKPKNRLLTNSFFLNFVYMRMKVLSSPEIKGYYDWLAGSYDGYAWEDERMLLNNFVELSREKGYNPKAVILPLIGDLSRGFKMKGAHEKVSAFFRSKGVPYLDFTDAFKRFPEKNLVVNRFDAHPNEFAHALIADEIWTKLVENDSRLYQ